MDALQELGRKMRDLAKSLGCDMDGFVVIPDLDGDANMCQVVFVLPDIELEEHPELIGVDVDAEAKRLLESLNDDDESSH